MATIERTATWPLPEAAARLQNVRLPVFRQIAALAQQHQAVNLAGGTPDFPAPAALKAAGVQAIEDDHNQYALSQGLQPLRAGISDRLKLRHNIYFNPESEITVCCGSTEAMTAALLAIINPGDEVIVFEPAFTSYAPGILLSGGKPVFVRLQAPDFCIEADQLAAAISPQTKAIIINSPHNPTGKIFSQAELQLIADACLTYNLLALTDEIYNEILFDNAALPVLWSLPGMKERTIAIGGFSKTYSVTGWRIGYAAAPPAFTDAIRITHSYLSLSAPAPLQTAAITAINLPESYYRQLAADYQERRDLLLSGLTGLGFDCYKPQGGYFIIAGFKRFSTDDDLAFARQLISEIGVAAIPVSGFYAAPGPADRRLLRFAFCKTLPTLETALQRLQKLSRLPAETRADHVCL